VTGRALDLACGAGRNALWLAARGWDVTGVDIGPPVAGITFVHADLEAHEYRVEPDAWDLILCWLYWQANLLPEIAAGVREGGVVMLAGKTSGRFATSLASYRAAFPGWQELDAGEDQGRVWFVARRRFAEELLD